MKLVYHPDAEAELISAVRFYEARDAGLGGDFLHAADRAIGVIQAEPNRWRIIESDVRRCLIPRFPYAIHYRLFSDHLRILAIKHHSQHPDYWRYRLSE